MDLQVLRYFCAIAAATSMTQAAETMNISQSALSMSLSKLESELNVFLFERLPRGIRLTPQGACFLEFASEAIQKEKEVRAKMTDLNKDATGVILIRCGIMTNIMAKAFMIFQRDHPQTELRFASVNDESPPDLIMTSERLDDPDLQSTVLLTEEILFAVPTNHHLAGRSSIRLEEIANEKFLSMESREVERRFRETCLTTGVTMNNVIKCSSIEVLWNLLIDGLGVSVQAYSWRDKCNDSIVLIPIAGVACARDIRLYWSTKKQLGNAPTQFKDYLIDRFIIDMKAYFEKQPST